MRFIVVDCRETRIVRDVDVFGRRRKESNTLPGFEKPAATDSDANRSGASAATPKPAPDPRHRWVGDISGAFADLGTFLPLVLGAFAVQHLDPSGVLTGFGVSALVVALVYRRPIPVQPMKAVAALVIAGGLGAMELAATGVLLGLTLLLLGSTRTAGRLARVVPRTVLNGIQLGVGLYLTLAGFALAADAVAVGMLALTILLLLYWTRFRPFSALLVVIGAAAWGVAQTDGLPDALAFGLWLPTFQWPDLDSFRAAGQSIFLPQLALTVTNAILVTAVLAEGYFPHDGNRISPDRLALSSGGLNLLLAPFGAFPMCHGAGGLVVQHRFGARTGLAPAIFGITCLVLGLALGPGALALLSIIPMAAVGALLVVAGAEMAAGNVVRERQPDRLLVILLTGLACVAFNVAIGLLIGLVSEVLRGFTIRHRRSNH
ncbi:MAG: putative sulfate/molybdate transporter [Wenzhouxiangellaceae bacterium]|nr:putative sulfate/molybdate transporter [Wenzhouxiangellaceae bacterium]